MKYKVTFQEKDTGNNLTSWYELRLMIPHSEIQYLVSDKRFAVLVSDIYHVTVSEPVAMQNGVLMVFTWIANRGMSEKFMRDAYVYYKNLVIRLDYSQLRTN